MKKMMILLLLGSTAQVFAQKVAKPDAYAKSITAADAKKHLYIIASPEMGGRETGTEGQRKAAAYIENYVQQLGLQPGSSSGYQQPYTLYQDSLLSASVEVNGTAFEMDKDFSPVANNIPATLRLSEVVVIGAGAADSLKGADLAGRVVLLVGTGNMAFYNQLAKKGPAAVLIVSPNFPLSRPTSRKGRQGIHAFRNVVTPQQYLISENVAHAIAGATYDAVKANNKTVQLAKADVLLDTKKTTLKGVASNVVALLPGTDLKDEYVVISAHYDHVGYQGGVLHPGADDDGSGTTGVLEIAEAFVKAKKEGKGPRRSIVFLFNSGEEKGLLGSEYYSDHPLFPLEKTTLLFHLLLNPKRKSDLFTNRFFFY